MSLHPDEQTEIKDRFSKLTEERLSPINEIITQYWKEHQESSSDKHREVMAEE